jgi:hypothetical protein
METAADYIKRRTASWRPRTATLGYLGAWNIEAQTLMEQTGYPEYVASIERMRRIGDDADVQYRFSYYGRGKGGRWDWTRRPLLLPAADLKPLLAQAAAEGTLLPEHRSK